MVDVKGKWALVTGSSRGIGKLASTYLADMGCNLILHSRQLAHTKSLKEELEKKGIKVFAFEAELSDINQVNKMLEDIDALGIDVDIVLNNAGYQVGYREQYLETPISDYETSFRINTIAPMAIVYHFLPKMIKRDFGRIVNTTSGIDKEPEQAGYSASKAALNKVTCDIATKINGTNVMINLVDPGWCQTDLGGPSAPNKPESALPGVLIGAFLDDKVSGRFFAAQDYVAMSIEDAVKDVINKTKGIEPLEEVVKDILDENLLTYHFQPIINARTGEIYSYEALMRSTTSVCVSPLDIIKYAEKMGRLNDIEKYTFNNTIDFVNSNIDDIASKKIFINSIPGVNLTKDEIDIINIKLKENSQNVVVEFTEQAELSDEELLHLKQKYEDLSIETAIDDYGTGYSNVSNLLRYMPKYVKIDRMLLSEIQNSSQKQHFVKEIIEFAHDNDIMALAEGVETSDELKMIIHLGADLIQGYYIAKPQPKLIESIPTQVKREIHQFVKEIQFNKERKLYVAGNEYRINLTKLIDEGYERLRIPACDKYHEIALVGDSKTKQNIMFQIDDGFTGRVTFDSVNVYGKRNQPILDIGEDCDVVLELKGENEFNTGGIRIPDGSKLEIIGEGHLNISCNYDDYFGIGNDMDKKHGYIKFSHAGAISILGNGKLGVAIGSGCGGEIDILSGKTMITMTGKRGVSVGCIDGNTKINVFSCDLFVNNSVYEGTSIGAIKGSVICNTKHVAINIRHNGTNIVGIGSHTLADNQIGLYNCSIRMVLQGLDVCGVGSFEGVNEIRIRFASLDMYEVGDGTLAIGDKNKRSKLDIQDGEVNFETTSKKKLVIGVESENISGTNGRLNIKDNK